MADVSYLSKYPYQLANVVILPFPHPLFIYKLFVYINKVESHTKYIHSELALEKYWVDKCGWMWLCTTLAMVMTIKISWKLFSYGINRDYYDKLFGIKSLLE